MEPGSSPLSDRVAALLSQAELFERADDPQGAVIRAKEALVALRQADPAEHAALLATVHLDLARYEEAFRIWQEQSAARASAYRRRELE